MATDRRVARIRAMLERRQPDLTLVLENVHDPHNVSAVLRTCDAAGVDRVALLYTIERFPRLGRKSSASAVKWVEHEAFTDVATCYAALHARGFAIYATQLDGDAVSLYDLDLTRPVAFVLGNEHRGVSREAAAAADARVRIPQVGILQSLNVSVSSAIILYEAVRQRLGARAYDAPKLTETELRDRLRTTATARRRR